MFKLFLFNKMCKEKFKFNKSNFRSDYCQFFTVVGVSMHMLLQYELKCNSREQLDWYTFLRRYISGNVQKNQY